MTSSSYNVLKVPASFSNEFKICFARLNLSASKAIDALTKGDSCLGIYILCLSSENGYDDVQKNNYTDILLGKKEENLKNFVIHVVNEFSLLNIERIPFEIKDTDLLLKIQYYASEVLDYNMLRLWARIFVYECCKPGDLNKRNLNIISMLDCKAIDSLKKVSPYCETNYGIWLGNKISTISNDSSSLNEILINLQECGLINFSESNLFLESYYQKMLTLRFGSFEILLHPGYKLNYNSSLTDTGLKLKKILSLGSTKLQIDDLARCLRSDKELLQKFENETFELTEDFNNSYLVGVFNSSNSILEFRNGIRCYIKDYNVYLSSAIAINNSLDNSYIIDSSSLKR